MAKGKKRAPGPTTPAQPIPSTASSKPPVGTSAAATSRPLLVWGMLGGIVLLVIGFLVVVLRPGGDAESSGATAATATAVPTSVVTATAAAAAPTPTQPAPVVLGPATYCRTNARFAAGQGLTGQVVASTTERQIMGLVVYEATLTPDQVRLGEPGVYQHPSWDDAGYLGPVTADQSGNIYTGPSPRVSLRENPLEKQNIVYRVDTETAEMTPLVDLPVAAPPSTTNPFGILGMTYDCDTHSLYVATVSGSTFAAENGTIFRIDPVTGAILSQLDHVDAMGMAIYTFPEGKRLYFGAARVPEVRSMSLTADGEFGGEPRTEIVLSAYPPFLDLRARRIVFSPDSPVMDVRAVEFYYNLVAASEIRNASYSFSLDAATKTWVPAN